MPQGPIDLSKIVLTDDYFSDVNPRSMRRLMNVIYITGKQGVGVTNYVKLTTIFRCSSFAESLPNRLQLVSTEFVDQLDRAVAFACQHDCVGARLEWRSNR